MLKYIFPILIFFFLVSCQSKETAKEITYYQAVDFSPEQEFTAGIEGPATDAHGNIYVVNYGEEGTIGIVTPEGKSSLFVKLPTGSIGNGIRLNNKGNLMVADYTGHNVLEVDVKTKAISVYAHHDSMNQPNDVAIMKNGILFCSDPNWGESTGNLWRVNLDGTIIRLESEMGTTNGVDVSPDEKTLYVNESVQRNVWAYDLSAEGEISNKRLLIKFPDHGMDGMRCDEQGNLFITRHGKGTIAIISPAGELIREVQMIGKKTSNIAFGGSDGRTAYVTLQDRGCLEFFQIEHPGREWSWRKK